MESIEIAMYVVIAVVIGIVIFTALKQTDYFQTYEDMKETLDPTDEAFRVDKTELVTRTASFWQACGFGLRKSSQALYYIGEDLDKEEFFTEVIRTNNCDVLESLEFECGRSETLGDISIAQNTVVGLRCDEQLYIE